MNFQIKSNIIWMLKLSTLENHFNQITWFFKVKPPRYMVRIQLKSEFPTLVSIQCNKRTIKLLCHIPSQNSKNWLDIKNSTVNGTLILWYIIYVISNTVSFSCIKYYETVSLIKQAYPPYLGSFFVSHSLVTAILVALQP